MRTGVIAGDGGGEEGGEEGGLARLGFGREGWLHKEKIYNINK